MKKYLKITALSIVILYVAVISALFLGQRFRIYSPDNRIFTPQDIGIKDIDIVHVTTADGLTLEGWYRKPQPDKPTIILFHGNAAHHALAAYDMQQHLIHGYGVLMTEYRGYAGLPGHPTEQGLYADGRAWMNWLLKSGTPAKDIIIYGQSIGTGIAVQMATEYPQSRALILFAPFTSLPDVARGTYFFIPLDLLMLDQYRNIDKIAGIKTPLLVMNGLADTVVPPAEGVALYKAAPQPKALVQIAGGGHNDIPRTIVAAKVEQFLTGLHAK